MMKKLVFSKLLSAFFVLCLLSSCSWFKTPAPLDIPPEELLERGMKSLSKKRYLEAAETFQQLRDRHPYSDLAVLAELKRADALYLREDYMEAFEAYEEFEKFHPKNEVIPYVIYQQGMCFYNSKKNH